MKRFTPRDITLYLMLILLMVFAVTTLQRMDQANDPTYSQVQTLFEQERVRSFQVEGNNLTLEVREEGDSTSTLHYELADPVFFYLDLRDLIQQQYDAGILTGYDFKRGIESSVWFSLLPYVLILGLAFLFWYMMVMRQSSAGSGGGPGPSRFGHARTRTLADQGRKVTFNDVAGADEEKEELQEIVEFLRDPQKFISLGARIPKGVLLVGPPGTEDPHCQGGGRGGRSALPVHLRLRFCGALCGRGRQPGAGSVRPGQEGGPRHRLY